MCVWVYAINIIIIVIVIGVLVLVLVIISVCMHSACRGESVMYLYILVHTTIVIY